MEEKKFRFKKGKIKTASQKNIDKVKNRRLDSFSVATAYWSVCLFNPKALLVFLQMAFCIIWKFFLVQYFEKFHIRRIPVKNVQHSLDENIPFRPELLGVYLDFINYWIRPLSMIQKRFGIFGGINLTIEFLKYIKYTYNMAYKVYSKQMTTTERPKSTIQTIKNLQFWDPHYLCVPSLHIAVICLTFGFHKMIFQRENFTEEESKKWNEELYLHGLEIAESVLYMKQHSVNCIGAAVYMMTSIAPEITDDKTAVQFINDLFKNSQDVSSVKEITEYIQKVYNNLKTNDSPWDENIINFIRNYDTDIK